MTLLSLTAAAYHADPAPQPSLSCSIAQILINQSPRHAWLAHPKLNPNFVREEDSRMDLGSAAHAMILEKKSDGIVWIDAADWRTKAAQEQRDMARAAGKMPVLIKYHDVLQVMEIEARRTLEGSELGKILDTGLVEQTILWQDGDIWCRSRLDVISRDHSVILDYKSTADARPEAFIRQIGRMGYDLQAEFYTRAVTSHHKTPPEFVFLAQEITEPYACSIIGLSNAYKALGAAKVDRAMKLWSYCVSRNEWPAYSREIHYAEPSPWELAAEEAA